ncbi:MAG TPA: amylo-alpha-1,6-glucosidase [Terriglobales bacterium]|nr:amylo-alpha-1,6-glucosidase [Terriglobales bacterium]
MSTLSEVFYRGDEEPLEEIPCPHVEPRLAYQTFEPRKLNNLTLIDGKTFISTTVAGDITPAGAPDVGLFHDDTRFLSELELRIGGFRTVVLSSSTEKTFVSRIELTTGSVTLRDSLDLPENTVHIRREQLLSGITVFDTFTFENFNLTPVEFLVELALDADFVDVFQARGCARHRAGHYYRPVVREGSITFCYRGLDDIFRETEVHLDPNPEEFRDKKAVWSLKLSPLKKVEIRVTVIPRVGQAPARKRRSFTFPDFDASLRKRREAFQGWEENSTHFESSNEVFDEALQTSIGDFHALQIPDGEQHILAAGIPWFATIFGRDSVISAYQALCVNPQLAVDTLRVLARYQGTRMNDWQDEQPGKILHEYRTGEMTRAGEMPFGPYYGSVDATPLFLILLGETFQWTADEEMVRELLPAAYRALDWIEQYGDLDGDGFVEYTRRSPRGLVNQGWKDSWDAIMHRDGVVAKPPIALAEVQGYVYDAKYRMASLLRAFGDVQKADQLKREAVELAKRFEKAFWQPQRGFYAMALDAEKKPVDPISSNPGHLLFTRILNRDRARTLVQRLMKPDMFSGWGWRTLSQDENIFNPLSYHRGSVWPHDNSLVAHGMALNEFRDQAQQIFTSLFQAALNFRDYRLPELFCGIQRRPFDEPVHYPVSCSPQAWASGAMFLILSSVLGIRPSAHRKELNIVNPSLPDWLDYLRIRNLRVGNTRIGLDFARQGKRTFCNVVEVEGEKMFINVAFRK